MACLRRSSPAQCRAPFSCGRRSFCSYPPGSLAADGTTRNRRAKASLGERGRWHHLVRPSSSIVTDCPVARSRIVTCSEKGRGVLAAVNPRLRREIGCRVGGTNLPRINTGVITISAAPDFTRNLLGNPRIVVLCGFSHGCCCGGWISRLRYADELLDRLLAIQ
jgi:hypothetical protein